MAGCLLGACDFCPRSSHWWGQNRSYQKKLPTPTNVTEVQIFLGFIRYYCQFIPNFMQVAWLLNELTSGENAGKKKAVIQWDSRCQQAFDDLKRLYTTMPILQLCMDSLTQNWFLSLSWQVFTAKHGCFFWSVWENIFLAILEFLISFIIFQNCYNMIYYP